MPSGQHAENLAWMAARGRGRMPQEPGLNALYARALAGEGEVLRISPQRTVLRLDAEDRAAAPHGWLLKIFHPRRRSEFLRRRLAAAPAQREHEAWRRLAQRLDLELRASHEQLRSELGLFARSIWDGRPAQPDQATAQGLAALHAARWVDRDLALDDLLWVESGSGDPLLLPLDLGQARVSEAPPPPERIYLALVRLLAGLPAPQAEAWAPTLLTAHAELLPDWESADLIARARRTRHRRVWKRSRRALRTCSDFLAEEGGGVRRRGFAGTAPRALLQAAAQVEGSVPLAAGPRSATWRLGDTVWKHYPREGAWQSLRRQLGAGPGRAAYRHLAVLELLGLPASRPLAWLPGKQGEWLATPWVEGSPAALEDLIDMAHWLATLHRHGFGLRDAKCSNFRRDAAGVLTLIDADGLTRSCEDAARDLARLVAECPKDGPTTEAILKAYFVTSEQSRDEAFEARFQERLAVFRAKLAR